MELTSKRKGIAKWMFGTVVVASIVYGFGISNALPLDIWRKDASGNIVLFPRTLTVDIASSTLSIATTTLNDCVSASWNPGELGIAGVSTSSTSTDIAFPGAVTGGFCLASVTTATSSSVERTCAITVSGTSTVMLSNKTSASAIDFATGTARVCRFK